jgi:hypothetical protein
MLRDHCAQARFVWNLAVEQHQHWRPGRNIVAGHAVTARGGFRSAGPVNREPHLLASFIGSE